MQFSTVQQYLKRYDWKLNFRIAVFGGLTLCLLCIIGYLVYLENFAIQPKAISGINLTRQPLVVSFADQQFRLEPFDTYSYTFQPKDANGKIVITATDKAGNEIDIREHNYSRLGGVALDIFSENDQVQQCFIKADVTTIFYSDIEHSLIVKVLSDVATNSTFYTANLHLKNYLYFGKYDGSTLPAEIAQQERVYGIYPVDCIAIADETKVKEDVLWWATFDPFTQRTLYEQAASVLD